LQPFGITCGYLTLTLAFLYAEAGISIWSVSILMSVSIIPNMLKFLWAPLVDATWTLKKWFIFSCVTSAGGLVTLGYMRPSVAAIPWAVVLILLVTFLIGFSAMAVNSLAAYDTPENKKGMVSGYTQAGNVGGSSIGGGAGLWMAKHLAAPWMSAALLAIVSVACCLALVALAEPKMQIKVKSIGKTFKNLTWDVWDTLKTKTGLLALFILLIPIGTGAASGLFAPIAKEWLTGADTVALVTGVMGGLLSAVGSFMGGWLCDKMDRKNAYILVGLIQAACCVGMALSPRTPSMYIWWTLLYSFTVGLTYAGLCRDDMRRYCSLIVFCGKGVNIAKNDAGHAG